MTGRGIRPLAPRPRAAGRRWLAWPLGELVTIGLCLALGACLTMGIPLVFGPNGSIDPLGYREYDEPETVFQMALSGLAVFGPLLIGGWLIVWSLRQRR